MPVFPEKKLTTRQQGLLDKCPLTQLYTNKELAITDPATWGALRNQLAYPLVESLQARVGQIGGGAMLYLVQYPVIFSQLLNPHLSHEETGQVTEDLLLMGYEMGNAFSNSKDIKPLSIRVLSALERRGVLNEAIFDPHDYTATLGENYLVGIICSTFNLASNSL